MSGAMKAMTKRYAAAGGAFNPTTGVTWAHAFYVEGAAYSGLGYGNLAAVPSWPSEVSALTATQTAGNRPAHHSSVAALNGQPAVKFDGSDDYMVTGSMTLSQPFSVVFVGTFSGGAFGGTTNVLMAASTSPYVASQNQDLQLYAGGSLQPNTNIWSGTPAAGLVVAYFNGASSRASWNGTTQGTGNAGTDGISGAVHLGARTVPDRFFPNHFTFIGFRNGDVTTDPGWPAFKAWAAAKYAVTIA